MTPEQKDHLVAEAIKEARRGMADGEAPIGCVIAVLENGAPKIVARGYNRSNALQRRNAHAEIVAFEQAGGPGDGTPGPLPMEAEHVILASSLEPCVMCLGAAMEAGVDHVLYALKAPADNGTTRVKPPESPESTAPEIEGGIRADESRALFEEWLKGKEGTEQAKFVEQLLALTD